MASPKSREEHMARRAKAVGQAATGKEFGRHQSTVSRAVGRGFTYEGSAADNAADKAAAARVSGQKAPSKRAAF